MLSSNSYESDTLASDGPEMLEVLELSRQEYEETRPGPSTRRATNPQNHAAEPPTSSHARQQELKSQISQLEVEITNYEKDIRELEAARQSCIDNRNTLKEELNNIITQSYGNRNGKGKATGRNFFEDEFPWRHSMLAQMKSVFGISSFRLCQEGVCNANLEGRDIVCVMPTGGGKSLTYQLPALITPGVTLVISPLLSLISDQIMHLKEYGIEAVKLTGSTSKSESDNINQRLRLLANGKVQPNSNEIKLCYVTPEKIAKSKTFQNLLQRLADGSKLARIVIDEAHCVSQLGHDFRPDYAKLRILRQLCPSVPILALSATCPPRVLKDLLKILALKDVVDGKSAPVEGTVYFSAPLYRKNLHYSIRLKHHEGNKVMEDMVAWIQEHHPNDSGIVYCLSRKDAEKVAEELQTRGKIRTGVYHADRTDGEKERLHGQWRGGIVKVVCATIAFGLGIDKGDVRFVLHHSISKSLDGYYQESGRAGRDGKDSDCVLFYRPQDAATLSSMTFSEKDGTEKLRGMLSFAQDLTQCRKLQFAKYFSHSSDLSINSWSTDERGALEKCGHCDNCTRSQGEIEMKDVTFESWQILMILAEATKSGGDLTLTMLAGLARGTGGAGFNVSGGGKGKRKAMKEKASLDLDAVCGGKVELKKDEIEYLLVELLLRKYLDERPHATSYSTVMYMTLGPLAPRLTRASKTDIQNGGGHRVKCSFVKTKKSSKAKGKDKDKPSKPRSSLGDTGTTEKRGRGRPRKSTTLENWKGKGIATKDIDDEEEEDEDGIDDDVQLDSDIDEEMDEDVDQTTSISAPPRLHNGRSRSGLLRVDVESDEEDDIQDDWEYSLRTPRKRVRTKSPVVLEISD
ncbi:ATP-dependent DNA helicase [Marasmius fiardii PR-910]|nr:ATP-dependent DNA helicase [Marasmius fiardii PR-910]